MVKKGGRRRKGRRKQKVELLERAERSSDMTQREKREERVQGRRELFSSRQEEKERWIKKRSWWLGGISHSSRIQKVKHAWGINVSWTWVFRLLPEPESGLRSPLNTNPISCKNAPTVKMHIQPESYVFQPHRKIIR